MSKAATPPLGTTTRGGRIGKNPNKKYVWRRCPSCKRLYWAGNSKRDTSRKRCALCFLSQQARTADQIKASPLPGDKIRANLIGYYGRTPYIWQPCNNCGRCRWVAYTPRELKHPYCAKCSPKYGNKPGQRPKTRRLKYTPDNSGSFHTLLASDTPKTNDLIRGSELGRQDNEIYRWTPCPRCGEHRWLNKRTPLSPMCFRCANDYKREKYIGEKSSQWKGGRLITKSGYILVRVRPTSPFYPMVNYLGYVPEHRLVMAEYLGRPLTEAEVVHHKHVRFPAGSIENKQDNRLDNLKLCSVATDHEIITNLEREVMELKKQISTLRWRIQELEQERRRTTSTSVAMGLGYCGRNNDREH